MHPDGGSRKSGPLRSQPVVGLAEQERWPAREKLDALADWISAAVLVREPDDSIQYGLDLCDGIGQDLVARAQELARLRQVDVAALVKAAFSAVSVLESVPNRSVKVDRHALYPAQAAGALRSALQPFKDREEVISDGRSH